MEMSENSSDVSGAEQQQLLVSLANNEKPVELARILLLAKATNMWVSMDTVIKSQVKNLLLTTLDSSELETRQTSSQAIAKVASIEHWSDLFQSLLRNMAQPSQAQLKQSTLETLSYLCQEMHEHLEVNSILRAVIYGSRPSEPSGVRLAATKTLLNVLGFAQANFGNDMECRLIMKIVYRAAISQEVEIRVVGFKCLVSIASKYYKVLRKYMELFELTLKAINGDMPCVALEAIGFWSTICDVEMQLHNTHSNFIRYNLHLVIPILLDSLREDHQVVAAVLNIIPKLLSHILKRLGQTLDVQDAGLQASLCGLLQFLVHKLSGTDQTKHFVLQNADAIMTLCLRVLACHQSSRGEAMLASGALACAIGPVFEKYVPDLFKYLRVSLQNVEECSITVGVVGDICRAIDDKFLPFCDHIMSLLLHNLQSDALPTSVKPLIFSCVGDIARVHLSERHLTPALEIMQVCAQMDTSDEEHAKQLKKSILDAYSGILQGCEDANPEVMMPYAQYLLQFLNLDAKT